MRCTHRLFRYYYKHEARGASRNARPGLYRKRNLSAQLDHHFNCELALTNVYFPSFKKLSTHGWLIATFVGCQSSSFGRHYSSVSIDGLSFSSAYYEDGLLRTNSAHPVYLPSPIPLRDWITMGVLRTQSFLSHLKWMRQKELLGQDIMLLGPPSHLRRQLAFEFCRIRSLEFEFISLSSETSESDLKQRREIVDGNTVYVDQCAVKAALEGRVLILEGLDKVGRNILPLINNLLENREMALEDGRYLVHPKRFQKLIDEQGYTERDINDKLRLFRVHPDFRVIALALPAPTYISVPLDPPLRSRFQSRYISSPSMGEIVEILADREQKTRNLREDSDENCKLEKLRIFYRAMSSLQNLDIQDGNHMGSDQDPPPAIPMICLNLLEKILTKYSSLSLGKLFPLLYPYQLIDMSKSSTSVKSSKAISSKRSSSDARKSKWFEVVNAAMEHYKIQPSPGNEIFDFGVKYNEEGTSVITIYDTDGDEKIISDGVNTYERSNLAKFVHTKQTKSILASMLLSHYAGCDIFLFGYKGTRKTSLVQEFSKICNLSLYTLLIYNDMNARDLLQKRVMLKNGDTSWENSPLVKAAINGGIILLDNVERLPKNGISCLQMLLNDRSVILPSGIKLVSQEYYNYLTSIGHVEKELLPFIQPIHPNFRVVAIGSYPDKSNDYVSSEMLGLFCYHYLDEEPCSVEETLVMKIVSSRNDVVEKLVRFRHHYNSHGEFEEHRFSFRQLLRAVKMANVELNDDPLGKVNLQSIIHRLLMSHFFSPHSLKVLNDLMKEMLISPVDESPATTLKTWVPQNVENVAAKDRHLIPNTLFYMNPRHARVLKEMEESYRIGEHLLLIGNQGTGKNKLVDKFLEQNYFTRQYIQLHRDTTVSSLTMQPSIINGKMVWEDSPLLVAARDGHVLVVDEADKAETEVVTILKNLVDGNMSLVNGDLLLSKEQKALYQHEEYDKCTTRKIIPIHDNFRMIVLANRPGWPFLGNNFFKECGDVFSVHPVDNPDPESELIMIKKYGPTVSLNVLESLSALFQKLRSLYDEGLLSYPYSTRELVNIVKHLERFSDDSISDVLENVFSYDVHFKQAKGHILAAIKKSGFDIGSDFLAPVKSISHKKRLRMEFESDKRKDANSPKHGKEDPNNSPHVGGNTWAGGTGGSSTAGLGGKGGPYRLDKGHDVHQLSDEEKARIDDNVLQEARKMGKSALLKRLKEIDMSNYEHSVYDQYYQSITKELEILRVMIEGLQAKNSDNRVWLKNQSMGDLDETKLVDSVVGDSLIYKRRGEASKLNPFAPLEKPKHFHFLMDCSASMYRFEGFDRRLTRMLETAVLIMESFFGFENKVSYTMSGHSGDEVDIPLVTTDNIPKDKKQRLSVLNKIAAHAQYCWAGDNTLEATEEAIQKLSDVDADETFLFVISDANFKRYRINPKSFGDILTSNSKVKAYGIFIASLHGHEARQLSRKLPSGRGFVCMKTSDLPHLLNRLEYTLDNTHTYTRAVREGEYIQIL